MAVTNKWFGEATLNAYDKEIDYLADAIPVKLHDNVDAPVQDTDNYQDDVTGELSTANGYTVGGQNLASKGNTYTGGTNVIAFTAADVVWTATGTLSAWKAIVSDSTPGSAATNPLLTFHESDAVISATDAAWTFDIPAAGFATITPA